MIMWDCGTVGLWDCGTVGLCLKIVHFGGPTDRRVSKGRRYSNHYLRVGRWFWENEMIIWVAASFLMIIWGAP